MKKNVIIGFIFVLAIAVFILLAKKGDHIFINNKKISVEIAKTPEEQALGLSNREGICQDCGMLFVFGQNGKHVFWMKDMKFDLDIIWALGGRVVAIERNVSWQNGTNRIFGENIESDKVLEVNAGKIDEWGIKIGDKIE